MTEFLNQQQFLEVLDRDEAERRFRSHLELSPLPGEAVPLAATFGRILAEDIFASIDVPGFDRSNVDGFALRAEDTFGAMEGRPVLLHLLPDGIAAGRVAEAAVEPGRAMPIATGGVVPRGANAVAMIEHTEAHGEQLILTKAIAPGGNISFAGSDIGRGELVLRRGELLTSRETGVLAALGCDSVLVVRRPRVAILSTGDELVAPGNPLAPGQIYDSNATLLADAVRELGGEPVFLGIVADDFAALKSAVESALRYDAVLLSGGTSKGAGDLSHRVLCGFGKPGIIAHGVALKPGKPLCLAVFANPPQRPVPLAVLPGFPTSAVFTFREFVAPVLLAMAGRDALGHKTVSATMPMRVNSERGRTEFLLVGLIPKSSEGEMLAFPMGKGSGSVSGFARADGFIVIPRQREYIEKGECVSVQLLDDRIRPVDLTVIGSHCIGLDYLLNRLQQHGVRSKFIAVGSSAGLEAVRRGECDLAGIHLLDPQTESYNRSFLDSDMVIIPGYRREQGILFRQNDPRFAGATWESIRNFILADPNCVLANRNRGSGTRILLDLLLEGVKPSGYLAELKTHQAVAAAVLQGRADWGLAIRQVAEGLPLGFLPVRDEEFDFVTRTDRMDRPAVVAFRQLLEEVETQNWLQTCGLIPK